MKIPVHLFAVVFFLLNQPALRTAALDAPPSRTNRDYTLFFAVDDYRPGPAPLSKPIANAEAIAREHLDRYGFATEVVKNPTLDQTGAKMHEYCVVSGIPYRPDPGADSAVTEFMVLVPGGQFEMGDQFRDGSSDEKPVHTVTLSDFYLGKTEVTVGEFRAFITATGYKTDAEKGDGSIVWDGSDWNNKAGVNWQHDEEGKPRTADNYPVVHVSWNDAVAYCNWLSERQGLKKVFTISGSVVTADWSADGYRLPTEAEWEYAARSGGEKYKYAWGNGDPNGNIADETARKKHSDGTVWTGYTDGYVYASPAGSFPQGDLGLSDMTGNVWEWCWDWYDSGYYGKSERDNPRGPGNGSYRVVRGGSWYGPPASVRVASRNNFVGPSFRNTNGGFRLARAAPGE